MKKKTKKDIPIGEVGKFVYESGILSKTPRSGLWFLGTGQQSVAEHSLRTAFIAYALCHLVPEAKIERAVLLALFHDFGEGRTSDLNYVHQRYGRLAEDSAFADIAKSISFGAEMQDFYEEVQKRETLEAKLVKDADQLEWLATLREEQVKGNSKAKQWATIAFKRLKTPAGKKLGKSLLAMNPDDWWFEASDNWFVDRKEKDQKWNRKKGRSKK
jgi:putative hydrolases of HD superfamily